MCIVFEYCSYIPTLCLISWLWCSHELDGHAHVIQTALEWLLLPSLQRIFTAVGTLLWMGGRYITQQKINGLCAWRKVPKKSMNGSKLFWKKGNAEKVGAERGRSCALWTPFRKTAFPQVDPSLPQMAMTCPSLKYWKQKISMFYRISDDICFIRLSSYLIIHFYW